jgi:hypothetical protein
MQPAKNPFSRIIQSAIVLVLAAAFYFLEIRHTLNNYHGSYSGFLRISKSFIEKNPFLKQNPEWKNGLALVEDTGYDGQLFYFISFDPLLQKLSPGAYSSVVDIPAFRYRRILYPLLTNFLSANDPDRFPKCMIYIVYCSQILAVFFLLKIVQHYKKNPFWALLYLLVPGFTFSQKYGLPEPLAAALVLGAFYFYQKERFWISALFLSLSFLVRETPILFAAILIGYELLQRKNYRSAIILSLSVLPYLLWRIHLSFFLGGDTPWQTFFFEPPNLGAPFVGLFDLGNAIWNGSYLKYIVRPAILLPLILTINFCGLIFFYPQGEKPPALAALGYTFLAFCLNYEKVWIHISNAERQTFESFLLFILFFYSIRNQTRLQKYIFAGIFLLWFFFDLRFMSERKTFKAGLFFF